MIDASRGCPNIKGRKPRRGLQVTRQPEMPTVGATLTGDRATSYKIDYSLKLANNAKLGALNIKTVPYTPYRTMALKNTDNK